MRSISVAFFGVLFLTNSGFNMNNGSSGDLQWTNYTTGVRMASASSKKILIDVYTDWCSWCKKMDKDTYGDEAIKDYLMKNYVLVRLNAESDVKDTVGSEIMTQADIARAYKVEGYPTTVFLASDGEAITSVPGYLKPTEFMYVLRYIAEDQYKKMSYQDYLDSLNAPSNR